MLKIFKYFIFLFFLSCGRSELDVELTETTPEINFLHYDKELFETPVNEIPVIIDSLALKYPVFISGNYNNASQISQLGAYIKNPLNQKLYQEAEAKLGGLANAETIIQEGFGYFNYYFPQKKLPNVYFYISGLNYEEPIIIADSVNIIVGKDLFLGSDYLIYDQYQIPKFVSQNFDIRFLPYQLFRKYSYSLFKENLTDKSLLEVMVALGKTEFLINAMFPQSKVQDRFAFNQNQIEWMENRERSFWKYLAEENYLFNTDFHEYKKFIEDRPFISSLERDSPGRAGIYIGYKIVREYMRNTNTTLAELMNNKDYMMIYKLSKYNP